MAVGLAVVAGVLALLVPYLDGLTAALAALSVASWAAGRFHEWGRGSGRVVSLQTAGILFVLLGAAAFFLFSGPFAPARGLTLGFSLVPLWLVERRHPPEGTGRLGGEG